MKKNKIAIVGPYPKPYGGISIHVQRVLTQLDLHDCSYDFYNESKKSLKVKNSVQFNNLLSRSLGLLKIAITKYKLIHYHSPNILGRLFFCCYGLAGKKVYIHVHGASLHDIVAKPLKLALAKFFAKYVYIIADNEDIYKLAVSLNPKKVLLIDSFLPPLVYSEHSEIDLYNKYSENVDLLISMVGWFSEYKGKDLYGFDIICEAVNLLKNRINVRILISVNGTQTISIYQNFLKLVQEMELENNIILITDDLEDVWPLIINTDIFVRPTFSDGSALSIKEALWMDVPVLASDCVARDAGCDLFKCQSGQDLYEKLLKFYSIKKEVNIPEKIKATNLKNFKNKLFEKVYEV